MACIYGEISKIDTTGASEKTASSDKLTLKGVEASNKMAENDYLLMQRYKSKIMKVGRAKQMDTAVIAAIISRESRAAKALNYGWDPKHKAFGLMQIDTTQGHTPVGEWDSEQHLTQATEILISFIKQIQQNKERFPKWTQEQCLKGGIAAYNKGVSRVKPEYENIDAGTTGGDYSNDVIARALWFRGRGYLTL